MHDSGPTGGLTGLIHFLNGRCPWYTDVFVLRKHAYLNKLNISPPKTGSFQIKNLILLSYFYSNIECGYSLEPPRQGLIIFLSWNRKTNVYPCKPQFYNMKVGFKGVKIVKACFRDGYSTEPCSAYMNRVWRSRCFYWINQTPSWVCFCSSGKTSNNIMYACKTQYKCLMEKHGMSIATGNPLYKLTTFSREEILPFGSSLSDEDLYLSNCNRPLRCTRKERYVAGSAKWSTKPRSEILTRILTEVKEECQTYYNIAFVRSVWISCGSWKTPKGSYKIYNTAILLCK